MSLNLTGDNTMRILLIQPKMIKRPMDTDLKTKMSPPLGLYTLMTVTPKEHTVTVINENIENLRDEYDFDLVGISVNVDVMPRASEIASKFQRKNIPVIAGGIHISCCPEECAAYFDAICIGPAELIWSKIIDDVENRCLNKIYKSSNCFRGEDIASPAYNSLSNSKYLYTNVILTSRGCPNRCDFCYNSATERLYVKRPIKDVISDIKSLKTKHIMFIDDNFIGTPEYTRELLEEMDGMGIKWNAAVTTKIIDYPELLDLMKKTGCQSLFIGFESINDTSLKSVNKSNQYAKYEIIAEKLHSHGIMINASMVFGLDGDDKNVFSKTLDWLVKNKIETLTSHILTPYPGTKLYKKMLADGRITEFDLSKYNTSNVVIKPFKMSEKELLDGYLWMYKKFYSFRNIICRIPEDKSQRKAYLLFNLFYRKFGAFTSALAKLIPMRLIGRFVTKVSYKLK